MRTAPSLVSTPQLSKDIGADPIPLDFSAPTSSKAFALSSREFTQFLDSIFVVFLMGNGTGKFSVSAHQKYVG